MMKVVRSILILLTDIYAGGLVCETSLFETTLFETAFGFYMFVEERH